MKETPKKPLYKVDIKADLPPLTRDNYRIWSDAMWHLKIGNKAATARIISAAYRVSSGAQRQALDRWIQKHSLGNLFARDRKGLIVPTFETKAKGLEAARKRVLVRSSGKSLSSWRDPR